MLDNIYLIFSSAAAPVRSVTPLSSPPCLEAFSRPLYVYMLTIHGSVFSSLRLSFLLQLKWYRLLGVMVIFVIVIAVSLMTTTSIGILYQAGVISRQQIKQQNDITYRRIGQIKVFEWPDRSHSCDPDLLKPAQLMNVWHSGLKVTVRQEGCNHRLCVKDGRYAAVLPPAGVRSPYFEDLSLGLGLPVTILVFKNQKEPHLDDRVSYWVSVCAAQDLWPYFLSCNFTINTTNTFFPNRL